MKSNESTKRFLEGRLKHNSTRIDDKLKIQDCLDTINNGNEFDVAQYGFVDDLLKEALQRGRQYNKKGSKIDLRKEISLKIKSNKKTMKQLEEDNTELNTIIRTIDGEEDLNDTQIELLSNLL